MEILHLFFIITFMIGIPIVYIMTVDRRMTIWGLMPMLLIMGIVWWILGPTLMSWDGTMTFFTVNETSLNQEWIGSEYLYNDSVTLQFNETYITDLIEKEKNKEVEQNESIFDMSIMDDDILNTEGLLE